MTQLVTYGSVGGVGRKPGPYPAVDAGTALRLQSDITWPGTTEAEC
jgi:hypothetical protein